MSQQKAEETCYWANKMKMYLSILNGSIFFIGCNTGLPVVLTALDVHCFEAGH
ncbi:hypothetical protein [Bacillus sp. SA1-12]|uniref:hypothetical protein n=1 Tax=Bacillus sp. SA1-12 TaxID=1455638 RepID=UPI000A64F650|nr:hypothetical protein [Bacillus sp. SA1-12]